MKFSLYHLFLVLCFVFIFQNTYAQKGILKNEANEAIAYANILLYVDSTMAAYQTTKVDGLFDFKNEFENWDSLTVFHLSYLQKTVSRKNFIDGQEVILLEKTETLKETIIRPDNKPVNNEVSEFSVADLDLKPTASLEDVLKQIPGVQVTDDGIVTIDNKPVPTILIDGDELTGKDYKDLTKGLSKSAVASVQVIRRWIKDNILEDVLVSSENVINIKLNRNGIVFGSASLMGTSYGENEVGGSLGYLGNTLKTMVKGAGGQKNIGELVDNLSFTLKSFAYRDLKFENELYRNVKNIVPIEPIGYSDLIYERDGYGLEASTNTMLKGKKNKLLINYTFNHNDFDFGNSDYQEFVNDLPIISPIFQSNQYSKKTHVANLSLNSYNRSQDSYFVDLQLQARQYDGGIITKQADNRRANAAAGNSFGLFGNVGYNVKNKNGQVWSFENQTLWFEDDINNSTLGVKIDPTLFASTIQANALQNNTELRYLFTGKNYTSQLILGQVIDTDNNMISNETNVEGQYKVMQNKHFFKPELTYQLSRLSILELSSKFQYQQSEVNTQKFQKLFWLPEIEFSSTITNAVEIEVTGRKEILSYNFDQYNGTQYVNRFNTITRYDDFSDFQVQYSASIYLNQATGNVKILKDVTIKYTDIKNEGYRFYSSTNGLNIINQRYDRSSNKWLIKPALSTYSGLCRCGLAIAPEFTFANFDYNTPLENSIKNLLSEKYIFSLSKTKTTIGSFTLNASYKKINYTSALGNNRFETFDFSFGYRLKVMETWFFDLTFKTTNFSINKIVFGDFAIKWEPNQSRWRFQLYIDNIMNNKSLEQVFINEGFQSRRRFFLIPKTFTIRTTYRF